MTQSKYIRSLHVIALLTAAATFPLIFLGGLVTSKGAGLSVPDWPNSYGYNMFLFPVRLWRGGIFFEHTHRLMGTVVGMLAIVLTIWAWRTESRRWVRWMTTIALVAVILQGVVGGYRVRWINTNLAIVHACFAQAFFCLAAVMAVVTSRWWIEAPDLSHTEAAAAGKRLIVACVIACITIYAQLIVGATMRHHEAGLAVPDFPLAYGQIIPKTDPVSLAEINHRRAWMPQVKPTNVTASQIWLHMGHRLGALLVTLAILHTCTVVLLRHRMQSALRRPSIILLVLLTTQVTLGIATVLKRKPADIASAHVAVGALTLMTTFILGVRAMRLFSAKRQASADRVRPVASFGDDRVEGLAIA